MDPVVVGEGGVEVATLAEFLRWKRGTRSQLDVAKAAGVPAGRLSGWEKGDWIPTFPTLRKLAPALGFTDRDWETIGLLGGRQ